MALPPITAIAAGGGHALALAKDGSVWSWGNNEYGQLGDGTTDSSITPQRASRIPPMGSIAASSGHSLGLDRHDALWVWGDKGCFGDADNPTTPLHVQDLPQI
jgi:alpha-tubulin suppressor-like RCC1 family protein